MSATAALERARVGHEPPPGVELLRHYLRDLVYGANDGIITTFAVVSGVAGASLDARPVLIPGAANLLADGFSMGASNYPSIAPTRRCAPRAAKPWASRSRCGKAWQRSAPLCSSAWCR